MFAAITIAAACLCGKVPERADDFFWENDKFGMRAYGPGDPHVWSGFDVFNKMPDAETTCGELLRNHNSCGNWHVNPYKGVLDNYTIGAGRGCGGIGVFADGEWKTFPDWKRCNIITQADDFCEFELVYPAFSAAGEMTCRISIRKGDRFFKNTVSFERQMQGFLAGPGLDLDPSRGHAGDVMEDAALACVSLFEDSKNDIEGSTMTAVFMDPGLSGNVKFMTDRQNCRILCTNTREFTYWAGAAWSKAGELTTAGEWHAYVRDFINKTKERNKVK